MTLGVKEGERALDVRQTEDGRRKINLNRAERDEIVESHLYQQAAALFLDINEHRTWQQIADELGLTRQQLKKLTRSPDFEHYYNSLFIDIGQDPRYKAAQHQVADLLPMALKAHMTLLEDVTTPKGVLLNAVREVYRLNGLSGADIEKSDREAFANFLRKNGILIERRPPVPENLTNSGEEYFGVEIIDGEVTEIEDDKGD